MPIKIEGAANAEAAAKLEAAFRGAGWNVIKVIWGGDWDRLLETDDSDLLVQRMEEILDGEMQRYTVSSGAYQKAIGQLETSVEVFAEPCPLFVPLVEEGWFDEEITYEVAYRYLGPLIAKKVDTIVLGCTHYPIIRKQIEAFFDHKVDVIDSGFLVAAELRRILKEKGLLNPDNGSDKHEFYVSDFTEFFEKISLHH